MIEGPARMVENMMPLEREGSARYDDRGYQADTDMDYLNEALPDMGNGDERRFCAGCGCRIEDRYFLMAAEKHWHVTCLRCVDCRLHLDNELTCFVRDGNVYCKEDYYRRFSMKCCAKCRQGIAANEMVMRARDFVYHMTCFICCTCNKTLLPGDYFGMRDCAIYCREDYEGMVQGVPQGHTMPSPTPGLVPGGGGLVDNIPFYPGTKRTQKGRPRKRKLAAPEGAGYTQRNLDYMGNPDGRPDVMGQDGYLTAGQTRQKRVRTSFKHHQLRAMKSYFNLNHNPDAKDLKQLAQKTGLSKRVLQVWFQNARAKYRRHMLKTEGGTGKDGQEPSEFRLSEDEKSDEKSYTEMSNNSSSSLSDMGSTPGMTDLPGGGMGDYESQGPTSLSDLFTTTISTIN